MPASEANGERAIATLKTWKILTKLRCCPNEAPRSSRRSSHSKQPRPTATHDEKSSMMRTPAFSDRQRAQFVALRSLVGEMRTTRKEAMESTPTYMLRSLLGEMRTRPRVADRSGTPCCDPS